MPTEIQGQLSISDQQFAIVVSRFNEFITSKLTQGAIDTLIRHGCESDSITIFHVPGAFEIAPIAQKVAQTGRYHAIICLGCIIRGQTPHFEFIASQTARGIGKVALDSGVPTTFGVLTCDSLDQASDRAGAKAGNKGAEAALSAIEMTNLLSAIDQPS